MAYVNDEGLIVAEPTKGDTLRIFYALRPKDYGALSVPEPVLISNHTTARWMKDGALRFEPGMPEMGARIRKRPAYTHIYVFRNAEAVQIVRYGRACIGTEGHVIIDGKRTETNRTAFQIEWDNWGACDKKGGRGAGSPTVNPKRSDARPNDPKVYPGNFWQDVPVVQAIAVAEVIEAVVKRSGMHPIDALHGHYELARDGHVDPGPQVCRALEMVVAPRLGLPMPTMAPARDVKTPVPIVFSTLRVS
jgi:hypothetical protein